MPGSCVRKYMYFRKKDGPVSENRPVSVPIWLVRHITVPMARYPSCKTPLVSLLTASSMSRSVSWLYALNVARSWAALRSHNTMLKVDSSVPSWPSPAYVRTKKNNKHHQKLHRPLICGLKTLWHYLKIRFLNYTDINTACGATSSST